VTDRLIDLGVVAEDNYTDLVEWGVPTSAGPSSRRWPAVAAILVLVGLFTAGSLPSAGILGVASVPGHTLAFSADGTNFYALRADPAIDAYNLRGGQARWNKPLERNDGQLYLAAGRPYVRHRPCTSATGWSLESLDPATGRTRWLRSGGPLAVLAGPPGKASSLLMVDQPGAACPSSRQVTASGRVVQQAPMRLSALDADTGATRWSFQLDSGRLSVADEPDSTWFAIWYPTGLAEIRDVYSGAVEAGGVLPELADGPPQAVRVIGDLLIVVSTELDGVSLNAYRRKGLGLAWRQRFRPTPPAPLSDLAYGPTVIGCGPMICIPTWRDVQVIDPASGVTVWQRDLQLDQTGPGVLIGRRRADFLDARIVDWRTGQDRVDLPGWGVVPLTSDDSMAGQPQPPGLAVLQHPQGDEAKMATVDLNTGQITILGTVSPMPQRCALAGNRLACQVRGDAIQLWRLPG
jgi:hypothetical protein